MISLDMYDSGDGGSFKLKNGMISTDESLKTVIYVSLFGGNNAIDLIESDIDYDEFKEKLSTYKETDIDSIIAIGNLQLQWMVNDSYADSVRITSIVDDVINVEIDNILKITIEVK